MKALIEAFILFIENVINVVILSKTIAFLFYQSYKICSSAQLSCFGSYWLMGKQLLNVVEALG